MKKAELIERLEELLLILEAEEIKWREGFIEQKYLDAYKVGWATHEVKYLLSKLRSNAK